MPVQECIMCGDMFNYMIKMDICPECQMDMADEEYEEDEESSQDR
jgi:hypothetical protein